MTLDRIEIAPEARADLDDVLEYIEARNPTAAADILARVTATLATLAAPAPRLDGPATRLNTGVPCRRYFVHPVTLYYDRAPGIVIVLRIYHHAREPITR